MTMKSFPRGWLVAVLPVVGVPDRGLLDEGLPLLPVAVVRFDKFASKLADDGPAPLLRAVLLLPPKAGPVLAGLILSPGLPATPNWPVQVGVPIGTERAISPALLSSAAASAATFLASASIIFGSAFTFRLPPTIWSCSSADWTPERANIPSIKRDSELLFSADVGLSDVVSSSPRKRSNPATPATFRISSPSSFLTVSALFAAGVDLSFSS